jgi:hypothetical protein
MLRVKRGEREGRGSLKPWGLNGKENKDTSLPKSKFGTQYKLFVAFYKGYGDKK